MKRRLCLICKKKLGANQLRFCSNDCRNKWKREDMRNRRGSSNHQHICGECGKVFRVGRPPLH